MHPSALAKRGPLILFIGVAAFYFYGLGHLPLLGPDEPRYAQIAREMFLRGDLITPTLGGHPWFEKPALLYWMMITSYKLFGVSEWSARLPAAVAGLLTFAAVFFMGRSVERQLSSSPGNVAGGDRNAVPTGFGFWTALTAATSLGIVVFSRGASFDIIVTMTMTWALAFFVVSEFEENGKARRLLLAGFYIFIGLSLLAKGLIGIVIPLGIVGAYFLFCRRLPERDTTLSLLWGIPLALLVAGSWYGPVIWRNGWPFVDQFFIQHQFARYVSDKYRHPAPFYFYLLVLIPLSLPWTAFAIDGIARARPWRRRANDSLAEPAGKLPIFAFAWLLVPLLFFSFSGSKLPGYILPALPAFAFLVGHRLTWLTSGADTSKTALRITAVSCLLVALATPLYAWRAGQPSLQCALLITGLLGIAGVFALIVARSPVPSILAIAGATVAVLLVVLHCWAPQLGEQENTKRLLQLADQRGYSQTAIYGLQRDDRSPEYYAGDRVVYGFDREPILYDGTGPVLEESRARKQSLLVFVPLKDLGYFTAQKSAQVDVIGDNGRVAIVAVTAR